MRERVAIVTGAGAGIPRQIAERLASDGARLVVSDVDPRRAHALAARLGGAEARTLVVRADATTTAGIETLFEMTARVFGRLDAVVHSVGRAPSSVRFLDMDEVEWDAAVRRPLASVYLCCQRAAKLMQDGGAGGCIVIMNPFGAMAPLGALAAHGALNGAVEAFTRSMAQDLQPFGIRANFVLATPAQARSAGADYTISRSPGSGASPCPESPDLADAVSAVAFLVSDRAAQVTGQTLHVGRGRLS
jgi:NAD(P)-dependent dehydrogenase (short-subunit alcohol dehydrogenase family)